MGELLEISWSSHHENLCEGIWRLFDTKVGRDFQILFKEKDGHRPLRAHFLIMQIFCQTLANSNLRQFQFEDEEINSGDLRCLLEFIYRGRTQVKLKRLKELKKAAEKLGLNSFVDIIQEKIEDKSLNFEVEKKCSNEELSNSDEKTKPESKIVETGMVILSYGSVSELKGESLKNIESNDDQSCFILKKLLKSKTTCSDNSSEKSGSKRDCISSDDSEKSANDFTAKKKKVFPEIECIVPTDSILDSNLTGADNSIAEPVSKDSEKSTVGKLNSSGKLNKEGFISDFSKQCNFSQGAEKEDNLNSTQISSGSKLICTECGRRFLNKEIFDQHVLNHSDPNGLPDQCPYCPFKTKYLRSHLASKHQRDLEGNFLEKSHKCDECDFICAASFLLWNHKAWKHGEKTHKCQHCPYASRAKGNLDKHLDAVHPNVSRFRIKKKLGRRKKNFQLKNVDDGTRTEEPIVHCEERDDAIHISKDKTENESAGSRDTTTDYDTISDVLEGPNAEMEDSLKVTEIRSRYGSKFFCVECRRKFKSKAIFDLHVQTHADPNGLPQCPYCPFRTKYMYLRFHLASKHQRDLEGNFLEKSFKCDECEFTCAAQFLLYNHKTWKHSEKTHKCEQCSYISRDKRALENHVLTAHTTEKNFMCETCGSFFNSKKKLDKHKMSHLSPQFTCEICGKIKIGKGNMKRHLNQHKTFECPICKYGFKARYKLKYHLQKTHKLLDDEVTRLIDIAENNEKGDNVKEK